MVTRRVADLSIRYTFEGGEEVEQGLTDIGRTGERTNERLERGTDRVDTGFRQLNNTVRQTRERFRQFGSSIALIEGPLGGTAARVVNLSNQIRQFGVLTTTATVGIAAFGAATGLAVRQFAQTEQQLLRLDGVLRATGNTVGFTREELNELAITLGEDTLTSANEAREAISRLLTFRTIRGSQFEETLTLAQDLAAVFGTTLPNAVTQLAKSIEDPIAGLTALRRQGILFTEQQREQIRVLAESGRRLEANEIILEGVRRQIGGAGAAEAGGIIGQLDTLGERLARIAEGFAEATGAADLFSGVLTVVNKTIGELADSFGEDLDDRIEIIRDLLEAESGATPGSADRQRQLLQELRETLALRRQINQEESRREAETRQGALAAEQTEIAEQQAERVRKVREELQTELELNRLGEAEQRIFNLRREELVGIAEDEAAALEALARQIDAEAAQRDRLAQAVQRDIDVRREIGKALEEEAVATERAVSKAIEAREKAAERQQAADVELLQPFRDALAGISEDEREFLDLIEDVTEALERQGATAEEIAAIQRQIAIENSEAFRLAQETLQVFTNQTTDALVELATTGRTSAKELVDGILEELLRLSIARTFAALTDPLAGIIGGLFTGGGSATGGAGATGFQFGGSFLVPGGGGRDSVGVGFLATPGERVTVSRPGQGFGAGVQIVDQRGATAPPIEPRVVGNGPDQFVRVLIRSEVNRQIGDGGLDQGLGTFGVKRQPIRRG